MEQTGFTFDNKIKLIMQEYNLSDLSKDVAQQTGHTAKEVEQILRAAIGKTAEHIGKEYRVEYIGFGVLNSKLIQERSGTTNGVDWTKPTHMKVKFRASNKFLSIVNANKSIDCPLFSR